MVGKEVEIPPGTQGTPMTDSTKMKPFSPCSRPKSQIASPTNHHLHQNLVTNLLWKKKAQRTKSFAKRNKKPTACAGVE
jgi:hypothetical protein